jgi:hypothetical protein
MSFFDMFRRKPAEPELTPFETELTGHGLLDWFRELKDDERAQIEAHAGKRAKNAKGEGDALAFLRAIAPRGRLGRKVLARAEVVAKAAGDPAVVAKLLDARIDRALRDMESDPSAKDDAIALCEQSIAEAASQKGAAGGKLPRHHGAEQLAILFEKLKRYDDALRVAKQARDQGWAGDWDARISRCESKRDRAREPDPSDGEDASDE